MKVVENTCVDEFNLHVGWKLRTLSTNPAEWGVGARVVDWATIVSGNSASFLFT